MKRKTYWSVREDRLFTRYFDDKRVADYYVDTHPMAEWPVHHSVSNPDTVHWYEDMVIRSKYYTDDEIRQILAGGGIK